MRLNWETGTRAHYSGENYAMAASYANMAMQTRLGDVLRLLVEDDPLNTLVQAEADFEKGNH